MAARYLKDKRAKVRFTRAIGQRLSQMMYQYLNMRPLGWAETLSPVRQHLDRIVKVLIKVRDLKHPTPEGTL